MIDKFYQYLKMTSFSIITLILILFAPNDLNSHTQIQQQCKLSVNCPTFDGHTFICPNLICSSTTCPRCPTCPMCPMCPMCPVHSQSNQMSCICPHCPACPLQIPHNCPPCPQPMPFSCPEIPDCICPKVSIIF